MIKSMYLFSMPLPFEILRRISQQRKENRRRASHNLAILLLLFFSLVGLAIHQVYVGRQILSLNQTGVHAQAKLISIEAGGVDDSDYQLDYDLVAPRHGVPGAPIKKYSEIYEVAPSLARELHEGQSIEVVYPADHPERAIPVIVTRTAFRGIGWITFFAAIVFSLLALYALSQLVKSSLSTLLH
jgi:hypothetical protein